MAYTYKQTGYLADAVTTSDETKENYFTFSYGATVVRDAVGNGLVFQLQLHD
jgi:hypothetical protein